MIVQQYHIVISHVSYYCLDRRYMVYTVQTVRVNFRDEGPKPPRETHVLFR